MKRGNRQALCEEIGAERRHEGHIRRLGAGRHPICSICRKETRPAALVRENGVIVCRECRARRLSKATVEGHHLLGRHNDPATIGLAANDHAAASDAQRDWPGKTLKNPSGSPLLRIAALIRGLHDAGAAVLARPGGHDVQFHRDLLQQFISILASRPEGLEELDCLLGAMSGPGYWQPTEPEDYPDDDEDWS